MVCFTGMFLLKYRRRALYGILGKYGHLDCEEIADRIVSEMERRFRAVEDDRTVLVMKIDHVLPEWSSFTPYSQTSSREKVIR